MGNPDYAFGHSDRELERLSAQALLLGPTTRQFFREAGIGAGMRVLDGGSGAGHTAFLAADLVGESGDVIGADRVATAIVAATKGTEAGGLRSLSFREGDPTEMV
jgi:ubiquinone/menaquinone biosynthesis C-methylase UbiE